MRSREIYRAAQETLNDMGRMEYGDPYAGHRLILGPALKVRGRGRARALRDLFGSMLSSTWYANARLWQESGEYRRVLVELASSLCDDIEHRDRIMRIMAENMEDLK
jgi:hypothetical protein